jgi:phosphoribosylformimino-5-aminoimidazole carboxamide ribotide isomerase
VEIIPVIDLQRGQVVRARLGRRDEYRPIETPLSATSDPVDVARGLLSLHPFQTLYLADLDAIESVGQNDGHIERLRASFPQVSLWVDNGADELAHARGWLDSGLGNLVIGSESQVDLELILALADDPRVVLSLDFRGEAFQGPPELIADPRLWPERVIAMTLSKVGSGAGPDLGRLGALRAAATTRSLHAAGGVRDMADMESLARLGIAGALVSTSLHDGRLTASDIARARSL